MANISQRELSLHSSQNGAEYFFRDFIPSSFVLLIVNGFTQFTAACLLLKNHRLASNVVLASGIILVLWIVLEWWVWGFNAISNTYFVLGLLEIISVFKK